MVWHQVDLNPIHGEPRQECVDANGSYLVCSCFYKPHLNVLSTENMDLGPPLQMLKHVGA